MSDNNTDQNALKTYRGNCHCGAFVYEVRLPEIKSVWECNCSLCYKKGYLLVMPSSPDQFRIVKGSEEILATYSFNQKKAKHKFCPTCGTSVLRYLWDAPDFMKIAVNAHTIQDLDTWSLERKPFDGASRPPPYEPPTYTGPRPTAQIEGGKLYTGGCHCGAVQLALLSRSIDATFPDTFPEGAGECNCSICERVGHRQPQITTRTLRRRRRPLLTGASHCISTHTSGFGRVPNRSSCTATTKISAGTRSGAHSWPSRFATSVVSRSPTELCPRGWPNGTPCRKISG
ncbi:hypothetical protein SODALDRAFT_330442 [Sodiomyces alkalinus F11]|uniref:CENP-V/GFA domain-containing protein n=1 Tax=Sodiomyces alkalinus (strain CBS 110278 / VKM F-3762 / F11) TaxID=1314773 RepID=A0A3N2Q1R1_SODAK|nr:hypothetical protein SODALDRAFT_330442 [Sodiomyces alkalinus F11]ROT40701.1 hypothetical protein SODALDRAFT_330442 [Sodiomyces alkalinus F11]